ncbi:MAG: hypothetical protein A3F09_00070 [Chlamydiae bacterium RIFCSPHIGHO2_12_FULL_49_11]|nr:MAG: hypothetical protein A3F09_00070 [Chlamydiae bacterium RIFCSPHIGHO2_12_FULL_49_11]
MHLFSLIGDKKVALGKGKVIPKEDFETVVSTHEMVEAAGKSIEAAWKKAKKEIAKLRSEEKQKGFEEGLSQLYEHFLVFEQELKVLRHEIQMQILPLVLKSVKKIIGDALEAHPEFIVDVVFQSIKGALQSRIVRIYVNKKDLPHIEAAKERIRAPFEHLENLHFDTRADIEEGSAIIETEKGIINATLESQFRALERAFETFKKR